MIVRDLTKRRYNLYKKKYIKQNTHTHTHTRRVISEYLKIKIKYNSVILSNEKNIISVFSIQDIDTVQNKLLL